MVKTDEDPVLISDQSTSMSAEKIETTKVEEIHEVDDQPKTRLEELQDAVDAAHIGDYVMVRYNFERIVTIEAWMEAAVSGMIAEIFTEKDQVLRLLVPRGFEITALSDSYQTTDMGPVRHGRTVVYTKKRHVEV